MYCSDPFKMFSEMYCDISQRLTFDLTLTSKLIVTIDLKCGIGIVKILSDAERIVALEEWIGDQETEHQQVTAHPSEPECPTDDVEIAS